MTQLLVRGFGDPQSAAKLDVDALVDARLLLPDPPAYLSGLARATRLPASAPQGRLAVFTSGPWLDYKHPITAVNRLRVVTWDTDPDACWDIATWIHAQLLAYAGDIDVHSYRFDSGPARGTDPDYDSPITAFTLRMRMRSRMIDPEPVSTGGGWGESGWGE